MMLEHHFRHLPVVDSSGRLRGVLSIRNLLHEQMEQLRQQLHSLEHYVKSEEPGATKARGRPLPEERDSDTPYEIARRFETPKRTLRPSGATLAVTAPVITFFNAV